jgi:hypothetical protein
MANGNGLSLETVHQELERLGSIIRGLSTQIERLGLGLQARRKGPHFQRRPQYRQDECSLQTSSSAPHCV